MVRVREQRVRVKIELSDLHAADLGNRANSTATYYNDDRPCEIQVPTTGLNFNSCNNDRNARVEVTIGQPGVSGKVGCFSFCEPLGANGNQDWQ